MTSVGAVQCLDGCALAYRLDGPADAPVLLLSHALGASGAMWDAQVPAFAERFRVLRYDMRGHGRSGATAGAYSMDLLARDVLQLLDGLGIEAVDYCGLSIGGMIGQWLAARAPGRIGRLAISNTAPLVGPPDMWQARIDTAYGKGMAPIVGPTVERWLTEGFRAAYPDETARIATIVGATDPNGFAGAAAAIRDMDLRPILPLIPVPTLVIVGTHDQGTSPEQGRFIAERVPGARLVELDAAHLSNVEQADAFTGAVLGFLG